MVTLCVLYGLRAHNALHRVVGIVDPLALGVLHPAQRAAGCVRLLGDLLAACVDFRRHTVLVSLQHYLRLNAQIILFRDAFRAVALRIIRKAAYSKIFSKENGGRTSKGPAPQTVIKVLNDLLSWHYRK